MVGTDFPYQDFYPRKARYIQIDADAAQLGKRHPLEVGIAGDCAAGLAALSSLLRSSDDATFLEKYQVAMRRWFAELDEVERDEQVPLRPQVVARLIADLADDSAIFTCDTGAVTYWAARNLRIRGDQRFTLSANLASMGYALPAAIAAKLAYPERQVVALIGDGGFTMGLGEFLTVVQYELGIKVVVFNNSKLGLIQMEQEARGYPEYQTSLRNLDFGAFGRLCGAQGYRVSTRSELSETLTAAFATEDPVIIDAVISGDELTVPPKISFEHARGYLLGKAREYLGQGDGGEPDQVDS
jgi:pyruvate oxidase